MSSLGLVLMVFGIWTACGSGYLVARVSPAFAVGICFGVLLASYGASLAESSG